MFWVLDLRSDVVCFAILVLVGVWFSFWWVVGVGVLVWLRPWVWVYGGLVVARFVCFGLAACSLAVLWVVGLFWFCEFDLVVLRFSLCVSGGLGARSWAVDLRFSA